MWKILLLSDSHGDNEAVVRAMEKAGSFQAMIHMGDVGANWRELDRKCPMPSYFVRGNCDYDGELKQVLQLTFGPHRLYVTHGHLCHVDYNLQSLRYRAMQENCNIALFGHTHKPTVYDGGPEGAVQTVQTYGTPFAGRFDGEVRRAEMIINPGSISRPRQADRQRTFALLSLFEDGSASVIFDHLEESGQKASLAGLFF